MRHRFKQTCTEPGCEYVCTIEADDPGHDRMSVALPFAEHMRKAHGVAYDRAKLKTDKVIKE